MSKVRHQFESQIVVLPIDNIDTDQIIPARYLKTISKDGLGERLFLDWRYDYEGKPKPDFVLNKPEIEERARFCWRAIISDAAARVNMRPGRCAKWISAR